MKSSQGKPKQSEVTLTQCHKGYEEEAGRSCKWLSSIKSSNKRIMEFPLTVNLKMLEVGKIQTSQAKPLICHRLLLLLNVNFSHCCIYVNYMASSKKCNFSIRNLANLIPFVVVLLISLHLPFAFIRHYQLSQLFQKNCCILQSD